MSFSPEGRAPLQCRPPIPDLAVRVHVPSDDRSVVLRDTPPPTP